MKRTILIKRYLPYETGRVWKAVTEASLLSKWFMENNLVPEPGREFTFRKDPQPGWNGITYCKVIEVEPFRKIAYTYSGKAHGEKPLACAGIHSELTGNAAKGVFIALNTILRFTLVPDRQGTCLVLEHSGFKGWKQVIVSFIMGMGWKRLMKKKLVSLLEKL